MSSNILPGLFPQVSVERFDAAVEIRPAMPIR
jgi:hypothetical protein